MTENQVIMNLVGEIADQVKVPQKARTAMTAQWRAATAALDAQAATQAEQDAIARCQDALAKGLPALAIGVRDAVRGFERGDPFAGSAAIMDICGTLTSTIGALSLAGGPPGALIGAVLSIVSMILKMFVETQESLTAEIERTVRTVQGEMIQGQLKSALGAISVLNHILTSDATWTFDQIQAQLTVVEGNTVTFMRTAADWLEKPGNQDLELWGAVLLSQCQVYILLKQTLAIAAAAVDVSREADQGANVYKQLRALFTANDGLQLAFLLRIRTAVQNLGTVWSINIYKPQGVWEDSGSLRFGESMKNIARGQWKDLGGNQRVFAISNTRSSAAVDPEPYVAAFHLEPNDSRRSVPGPEYRNRQNKRTYVLAGKWPLTKHSGWKQIRDLNGLHDICATPGEAEHTVYLYTADGKQISRYVHGDRTLDESKPEWELTLSQDRKFPLNNYCTVDTVCATADPRTISGGDPGILAGETSVVYGGGQDRSGERYIRAFFSSGVLGDIKNPPYFVPGDSPITGMKTDSKRLWVFTRRLICCVTHAAVKAFIVEARRNPVSYMSLAPPEWASYQVPGDLGGSIQTANDTTFDGLHEIAPCDDGALWAVFADRSGHFTMYHTTPDLSNPKLITIAGGQKDFGGHPIPTRHGWIAVSSEAHRIDKQPLYCWRLVEGLTDVLMRSERLEALTATT